MERIAGGFLILLALMYGGIFIYLTPMKFILVTVACSILFALTLNGISNWLDSPRTTRRARR
jgi:hypothetical protein